MVGPSEWFKKTRENEEDNMPQEKMKNRSTTKQLAQDRREFHNMFFIQHTENSKLKKSLQAMEDAFKFKTRWRYVEKTGSNIGDQLVTKDPWGTDNGRVDCIA